MNCPTPTIVLCAVVVALTPTLSAEPAGSLPDSVLLLRNGEVLCGPITRVGDRYVVMLGDNSELRIAVPEVEMHCLTLEEAYLRKRSTVKPESVVDHLAMVDWCLRNSMNHRAADELLRAIAIDPRHAKIAWYERRVESAVRQPEAVVEGQAEQIKSVNLEALERTMQDLPEEAVEAFVSRVQPLLLNRCGASTCHGSRGESEFRLVRPGWGKTVTRRFTQRNLYAALQAVDRDSPAESPLLLAPNGPHGNVAGAIFSDRDEPQLRLLVDWVRQVTSRRAPAEIVSEVPPSPLMRTSYEQPVHLPQAGAEAGPAEPPARQQPATVRRTPPAGLSPRDPFDPAIFNRRFLDADPD